MGIAHLLQAYTPSYQRDMVGPYSCTLYADHAYFDIAFVATGLVQTNLMREPSRYRPSRRHLGVVDAASLRALSLRTRKQKGFAVSVRR